MSTLKLVRYVAWGAVAVITAALLYVLATGSMEDRGVAAVGGPFRLKSHHGTYVDSKDLLGKPYVLYFGFTNCPDVCPTSMLEITNDLNALGKDGKGLPVYFVTVDPERDTAELLKAFTGSFDSGITGLIPSSEEELAQVARAFRAVYRRVPTPSGYTMDHTASLFLMDAKGQFFGTLDSRETLEVRLAKLRRLVAKR